MQRVCEGVFPVNTPGGLQVPGLSFSGDLSDALDQLLIAGSEAASEHGTSAFFWSACLARAAAFQPVSEEEKAAHAQVAALLPRYFASALELDEEWGTTDADPALAAPADGSEPRVTLVHISVVQQLLKLAAEGAAPGALALFVQSLDASASDDAAVHRRLFAPLLWELSGRVGGSLPKLSAAAEAAVHKGGAPRTPCFRCNGLCLDVATCGDAEGVDGGMAGALAQAPPLPHHVGPSQQVAVGLAAMAELRAAAAPPDAAAAARSKASAAAAAAATPAGAVKRSVSSLLVPQSFAGPLRAVEALLRCRGLLSRVLTDPAYGWGAALLPVTPSTAQAPFAAASGTAGQLSPTAASVPRSPSSNARQGSGGVGAAAYKPPCDGVAVQTRTLLGRLMSLGPRFRDFLPAEAFAADAAASSASAGSAPFTSPTGGSGLPAAFVEALTNPYPCLCEPPAEAASAPGAGAGQQAAALPPPSLLSAFLRSPLPGEEPLRPSASRTELARRLVMAKPVEHADSWGRGRRPQAEEEAEDPSAAASRMAADPLLPLIARAAAGSAAAAMAGAGGAASGGAATAMGDWSFGAAAGSGSAAAHPSGAAAADPYASLLAAGVPRLLTAALAPELASQPSAAAVASSSASPFDFGASAAAAPAPADGEAALQRYRERLELLRAGLRAYELLCDGLVKLLGSHAEPLGPAEVAALAAKPQPTPLLRAASLSPGGSPCLSPAPASSVSVGSMGAGAVARLPSLTLPGAASAAGGAGSVGGATASEAATATASASAGAPASVVSASISAASGRFFRGREALFAWMGLLLDANAARTQTAYATFHATPALVAGVSHPALLFNAARAFVKLCAPFLDPSARRAADLDIRYFSRSVTNGAGGGRFHAFADERLAPFWEEGGEGGGAGGGASWLDARNLARQEQYRQRQLAMQRSAAAAAMGGLGAAPSGAGSEPSLAASDVPAPVLPAASEYGGPIPWNAVTEFFGLAVRGAHLSLGSALARGRQLTQRAHKLRSAMLESVDTLLALPNNGMAVAEWASVPASMRQLSPAALPHYQRLKHASWGLAKVCEGYLSLFVYQGDMEALTQTHLPLQRLLAVTLTRAVIADAEGYRAHLAQGVAAAAAAAVAADGSAGGAALKGAAASLAPASLARTGSAPAAAGRAREGSDGGGAFLPGAEGAPAISLRALSSVEGGAGTAAAASPLLQRSPSSGGSSGSVRGPSVGAFASPAPPVPAALRRLIAGGGGGGEVRLPELFPSLPLPPPSRALCSLPEHLLADMAELVRWIPSHAVMAVHPVDPKKGNPGIFYEATEPAMRDVATALLIFLASPLHLHNPYLRGNLAKALQVYIPSRDHPARYLEDNSYAAARVPPKRRGARYIRAPLHSVLPTHPLAITALGPAVVAFHVDIAASGGHSSFYDKFSVRVSTSDLLDYAYGLPQHKEALIAWAREGQPGAAGGAAAGAGAGSGGGSGGVYSPYAKALRFASAVVDDLNHHMDEALKSLREIRELERLKADAGADGAWGRLTAAERTEKEQRLSAALGQARSWLYYAQGQLQLLGRLSDGGAGASLSFLFLSDDLRDRLSANLGYYLDMLVNPGKRNEFKVADAAGIGFAPRDMLLELMTAYANLAAAVGADVSRLAASIVADERSYRRANWAEAASLAGRFPPEFVDQYPHLPSVLGGWTRLGEAVVAAEAAAAAEAENLGELPDEVCDPITAGLMVDPVRLPSSGQVMDRGTIMTHLLGEERDPYNRSHLTADMLIPLPQVAAAVAAWRAARMSKDGEGEAAALARVRLLVDGDGSTPGEGVAPKEEKERPALATASATETASPSPAPSTAAPATATERSVAPQRLFESPTGARLPETAPPAAALGFGGGGGEEEEEDEEELQRALALSMDAAGPSGSRTDSRRSSAGLAPAAAAGVAAAPAPGASGGEDELDEEDDLAEAIRLSMQ